jgi:putative tricarboxylic transport membrane protein
MVSGCIGVLIAMVGLDAQSGVFRFGFGNVNFIKGLGLLPILLGVFALPNILRTISSKSYEEEISGQFVVDNHQKITKEELKQSMPSILRSSVIGCLIGAMPGTGAAIASFMSYNDAKNSSKHPELFGTGVLEGVAAPEAANNAVSATSLIPLFTLGIPGSVVAATLVGALTMHGLVPGPGLFKNYGDIMYSVMIGTIFINMFMFLQGKFLSGVFSKVAKVPQVLILPMLLVICVSGAFSFSNSMFDVYVLIVVGLFAYVITKLGFPGAPIVIGIILGPLAEINLSRALVMAEGDLSIFVTRPFSLLFIILTIVFVVVTVRKNKQQLKKSELKV